MPEMVNESAWLEGFIGEAAAQGLDKTAATELLKTAVRRDMVEHNPAFAEGYRQEMEKQAAPIAGGAAALAALRRLLRPGAKSIQTAIAPALGDAFRASPRSGRVARLLQAAQKMRGVAPASRPARLFARGVARPGTRAAPAMEGLSRLNVGMAPGAGRAAAGAIPPAAIIPPAAAAKLPPELVAAAKSNPRLWPLLLGGGVLGGAVGTSALRDWFNMNVRRHWNRNPFEQGLIGQEYEGMFDEDPVARLTRMYGQIGQHLQQQAGAAGGKYMGPFQGGVYGPYGW